MFKINALVPELIVTNLQQSLLFYCDVLGFKVEYDRPEDNFALLSFGASQIMLEQDLHDDSPWRVGPLERPFGRGMNLSIECPDARRLVVALESAGYALRKPIETCWYRSNDQHFGQLNFLVSDPDGYLLRFAEDLGSK